MSAPSENPTSSAEPAAPPELLSGHEYDGIQEFDNPMPRWWVWLFWGSFYFSVCYLLWLHVYQKGTLVGDEYASDMRTAREEMARREMGSGPTEESLTKLMSNAGVMADAELLFKKSCSPCHSQNGEGLIGPNLTDQYWIHGQGKLMDIFSVVNGGVPAKGMPAWGKQLPPIEVAKAVAYVGTLRGRGLPGRPPEGTLLAANAPAAPAK